VATHDYVIANGTGAAVRSDINGALAAIVSQNSNASEPATMYAYQWWADTTTGLLKIRNAANSAWVTIGTLASANLGLLPLAGGTMTGVLAVTAGTAALPGIAVSGDPNTGIYSPGADQIGIATGGTGRVFVSSAGLVGIGTTGPLALCHVSGGNILLSNAFYLASRNAANNASLSLIGRDTSDNVLIDPDGYGLKVGGTTIVTTSAGRVGIGTTSPSSNLHVSAASGTAIKISETNNGVSGSLQAGSTSVSLGTDTNHSLNFYTNAVERARIDTSGRLLVGTSSVSSSVNQVEVVTASSGVGFSTYSALESALRSSYSAYAGLQLAAYQVDSGAPYTKNVDIVANSDGTVPSQMRFLTKADGAASPTERMRITSTGQSIFFTASTSSSVITRNAAAAGTSIALLIGAHSATGISDGTNSFIVWTNGNVVNTNNSYGAISDVKLKENIVDANSQWDDLKALQVRNYNFKEGQTHTQIGLVAQEVELVSPGLVSESPDRDEEGNDLGTVTKAVNYSVLYMKAVKALQEAMERIESLETRLSALEAA